MGMPGKSDGAPMNPWKAVISGGITGAIEASITFPTEFIKTYMQLYKEWSHAGMKKTINHVYTNHGVFGFYRGLQVLVFFSVPKTGSRFGAYTYASTNLFPEKSRVNSFMSGLFAGTTEALLAVTPMETIKTKLIHDSIAGTKKYRGLFHGIYVIASEKGPMGLYQGLIPTILRQSSNQAVRFCVYNDLSVKLKDMGVPETPAMLLAGGVAGGCSVYANTPVDVVKTNMQGETADRFKGPLDCAQQIWKNEGLRGFYKGTVPRLTRVVIDVGLTFALYEHIKRAINQVWP